MPSMLETINAYYDPLRKAQGSYLEAAKQEQDQGYNRAFQLWANANRKAEADRQYNLDTDRFAFLKKQDELDRNAAADEFAMKWAEANRPQKWEPTTEEEFKRVYPRFAPAERQPRQLTVAERYAQNLQKPENRAIAEQEARISQELKTPWNFDDATIAAKQDSLSKAQVLLDILKGTNPEQGTSTSGDTMNLRSYYYSIKTEDDPEYEDLSEEGISYLQQKYQQANRK